ncbi:MAG: DUF1275 family protein [Sphingomonadales bacterium]|nr:DUF1275 family protein [Sphingomonadales bacterium]
MNRLDQQRRRLASGLAALAGFVDAVGFLSADGYFVSFMSGNTTRLGVDLARGTAQALVPALLLAGFVGGVALGAVAGGLAGGRRKRAVLAMVTALLLAAALARASGAAPPALTLGLLVGAMGALNNTFVRDGEVSVGLTYMTGALVKLGRAIGARLLGAPASGGWGHAVLWLGLAGGAVLGALAFGHAGAAALWLAAGWSGAMLAVAWRLES